jgi:acetylornithine deacetylase
MPTLSVPDRELAAAVAAEERAMEELLAGLVAAPTVLGDEELGQQVMRDAFRDAGLEPRNVQLDPGALRASPFHSPFSWDVGGKANVVADWGSAGRGGRPLVLNGTSTW